MSQLPQVDPAMDHIAGAVTSAIVLVEYGDFQCPYCGAAYFELKKLQRAMGEQLCLVFRHFPLTQMHEHALQAAEFAEAAGSTGRFWEMHDILFERQDALEQRDLIAYARSLGMDKALIEATLAHRFEAAIRRDFSGGVRSGVNGTPCLFINGNRFDGPATADVLLQTFAHLDQHHRGRK
jgi:protein-disulfide isomerase